MNLFLSILIAGFGGGLVRGLIGYLKTRTGYTNRSSFSLTQFLFMAFISGIIGLLTAYAIDQSAIEIKGLSYISPAIAFVIGYAGGDFLEGLYKILIKNISLTKKEKA
ncbi:MAG: hypothetical protein PHG23_01135 [Candidatus Pacebacteria bacterium]|nr:hypothetical protein [Candidatus Paceibacterota bacterium]